MMNLQLWNYTGHSLMKAGIFARNLKNMILVASSSKTNESKFVNISYDLQNALELLK